VSETAELETLRAAAFSVMARAYAPYSSFRVGAALVTTDDKVFVGCNVENASFPAGLCAERAALAAAVAHGERRFARIVIATDAQQPSPPCGVCRQVLAELAPQAEVISCTTSGAEARWPVSALLPHPFTPHSLERT
jgi:cytidine deaminase